MDASYLGCVRHRLRADRSNCRFGTRFTWDLPLWFLGIFGLLCSVGQNSSNSNRSGQYCKLKLTLTNKEIFRTSAESRPFLGSMEIMLLGPLFYPSGAWEDRQSQLMYSRLIGRLGINGG
jgi:hypothetical protein